MTSHEIIAFLPPEVAAHILDFSFTSDRKVYRAAMEAVAQARRLRSVFLERQPRPQRDKLIIESLGTPKLAAMTDNLVRHWLLSAHKGMLGDFLDALGVKHENGVVENLPDSVPDPALRAAIDGMLAKHPQEAVVVYLHGFNTMNDSKWTNLDAILVSDARLDLEKLTVTK